MSYRGDYRDVGRYLDKVVEAIRRNLPNIIASIDGVISNKSTRVRVRIPNVEPLWFRPDYKVNGGQGEGSGSKPGEGSEGGLIVEMSIDELKEMVWEYLKLPRLDPKKTGDVSGGVRFYGYTRKGPPSRLSIKRTLMEQIRYGGMVHENIFRYREIDERPTPNSNAVVVLSRDRSGSITDEKVYIIRVASWWIVEWLRRNYSSVNVVFLVHDYEAEEVDEKSFFWLTSGGGTRVKSVLDKGWEILQEKYPHSRWNRYFVYFGDGEATGTDMSQSVNKVEEMLDSLELFAYGEVGQGSYFDRKLIDVFREKFEEKVDKVKFRRINEPKEISEWLAYCFS